MRRSSCVVNTFLFSYSFYFLISTYIGFFQWKNLKIIKYTPTLVGFMNVLFIFILKRMTFR
ncbi:hypothetical protein EKA14_09045 [Bacillus mycoides]|nr:hypothetical protein EKA14_09045 [Bacillus mycoides]